MMVSSYRLSASGSLLSESFPFLPAHRLQQLKAFVLGVDFRRKAFVERRWPNIPWNIDKMKSINMVLLKPGRCFELQNKIQNSIFKII